MPHHRPRPIRAAPVLSRSRTLTAALALTLGAALSATPAAAQVTPTPPATSAATGSPAEAAVDPWSDRLARRGADVLAVLAGTSTREAVFTADFNDHVSQAALTSMMAETEAQFGPLLGVESVKPEAIPGSARYTLRFERALLSGPMRLDAKEPFQVSYLLLDTIDPITDGAIPVAAQVAALPGVASLLLTPLDGSPPALEVNSATPLAIGSTFKLYVLSALVQEIAAGRRKWEDVVALDQRSYPSGILQDWPSGTPMTLQSLATLMIAISDNTAADQLITTLGRDVVEAEVAASGHSAPALNTPFLTTREMFVMKAEDDTQTSENLGQYAAMGTPERLAVLQALQEKKVALDQVSAALGGAPRAIDIEWFASGQDIARVFARLHEDPVALAILGVNPALGEDAAAGWAYVGFKGGSEPGVLNMSWLLRNPAGAWYVLSVGWNNPDEAIPAARLLGIARTALATLDPAGG